MKENYLCESMDVVLQCGSLVVVGDWTNDEDSCSTYSLKISQNAIYAKWGWHLFRSAIDPIESCTFPFSAVRSICCANALLNPATLTPTL